MQKQIETNKALMEQVEPLSIYRATLKLLEERTRALLGPDAFIISGDPASAVRYDDGLVSTTVRLPGAVGIELKANTQAALATLFSLQDVVRLGESGLVFTQAPAGKLLGKNIIDHDFNLSMTASIAHAVQFRSTKGEVLYELVSDPMPVASLASDSASLSNKAPAAYRAAALSHRSCSTATWFIRTTGKPAKAGVASGNAAGARMGRRYSVSATRSYGSGSAASRTTHDTRHLGPRPIRSVRPASLSASSTRERFSGLLYCSKAR